MSKTDFKRTEQSSGTACSPASVATVAAVGENFGRLPTADQEEFGYVTRYGTTSCREIGGIHI